MELMQRLARRIVREGWFVPSVRSKGDGAVFYTSTWEPLWGDPAVDQQEGRLFRDMDKEQLTRQVNRLVQDRFSERLRSDAFRMLQPRYGVPHTPLEHWTYGLVYGSPEAPDNASGVELPSWLADDVLEWQRTVVVRRQHIPVRVTFVLLEPVPGGDPDGWLLAAGLQAEDDESLFVLSTDVWTCADEQWRQGGRVIVSPQERLAAGLAAAADRFPPIGRLAVSSAGCALSLAEAVQFMEQAGPLLEAEGFGVVLPEWWTIPAKAEAVVRFSVVGADPNQASPVGTIGFDTLMEFNVELLLDGDIISEERWGRFMTERSRIVPLGDRWIRLSDVARNAAQRFYLGKRRGTVTAAEAIRLAMTAGDDAATDETAVPVVRREGDAWFNRIVEGLRSACDREPLPAPERLQGTLRDYQLQGFSWLVRMRELGFGACLADDMGLGKTVQWIAYILHIDGAGGFPNRKPHLLLCPTSVLGNWQRELERFAPSLEVCLHYGPDRDQGERFRTKALACSIVLTSYSTALRDRTTIGSMEWRTAALDEAQYVKNSESQLSRFVRTLKSEHNVAMTGTPVENRLADLWSIFEFINPGYLGSERNFRRVFGGGGGEREAGPAHIASLRSIIRPFILRRMKSDRTVAPDLPEKIEQTAYCGLTNRQVELYEAVLKRLAALLKGSDGMRRKGVILSAITKLKQICNAPEQALRERSLRAESSGKLMRLAELLAQSLEQDDRCIVFTQYASMANLLQGFISDRFRTEAGVMTGQTARKERERLIERFQHGEEGPKVLVLTLKTGGFGLNLTRAHRLIHYDRWWNPAVEKQAADRSYRIGQTRAVEVWKLLTKGTLEESIDTLLESKEKLAEEAVGTGEQWLTEYGDEQLTELLSLRRQIVVDSQ